MKKKSIGILCLVIVIAVALNYVAFLGYNIAGFTYGGMFDAENGIRKGIDLAGGSVITFQANAENPTSDEMASVEAVFERRLTDLGYTEARISSTEDGKTTVEIPSVFNTDEAADLLKQVAKLTFCDADGNELVTGEHVKNATAKYGTTSETQVTPSAYVELEFTAEGKDAFAAATRSVAAKGDGNNYLAIKMDETIIQAPRCDEEINSTTAVITGIGSMEEATALASSIRSGNLPFELSVITQETVGAELGATALPKSLLAAGIGILLIMVFMVVMYRIPGLVADISLAIYVGIVALILGLTRTNLSLSGIAGIVLSIGMAVDANVIIFERIKEELRLGKTIRASVEAGFNKAFSAILDSNITTIIICVVLYLSGIGTVTGFATTLGIGVVVSMLTAIVITKFLLKQVVNLGISNRALFCSQKKKAEKEGMKHTENRWKMLLLPVVIIAVGAVSLFAHGGFNYDIEFVGGIRMQVELGTTYDNEEISDLITDATGVTTTIQKGATDTQVIVKTPPVEEDVKNQIFGVLKEKYALEDAALMSTSSASASFGNEVQQKTLVYALIAILLILVYIAFRFEWRSAIMAVLALAVSVIVMFAVYAITNIPMNTTFVAAMLTIIGYSINNTIVIFDRIRENMKYYGGKKNANIISIVNTSISECMGRTLNSTITTLITIVLLYIIGVSAIRQFALPLIIGIVVGTYTSIFMAGPFLGAWKQANKDAKAVAKK